MRLSKERKAYLAVFGLGLAALLADRLFFAPAGASAAPSDAAADPTPPPSPEHPPADAIPAPTVPSFAERLDVLARWPQGQPRDAFTAPVSWVGPGTVQEQPVPAAPEDAFAESHRVSVVAKGPWGVMAVIGGKTVKGGEMLDGFTLVDVQDTKEVRAAIFEREGVRVRLPISDKPAGRKPDKTGN